MPHDDDTKQLFLDALARCGVVGTALRAAGIKARATVNKWRENDPQFADAYDEALETAADSLESEARRRAEQGVVKAKFYPKHHPQAGEAYDEYEYSDTLMIALLKANKPDKFADRSKAEITNPDGSLKPENETAAAARIAALLDAARQRREAAGDPLFD